MRRTVALVAGLCTAVALAGVAGAATLSGGSVADDVASATRSLERPQQHPAPVEAARRAAAPATAAPATATPPDGPAGGDREPATRLPVGVLDRVDSLLGYLSRPRSETFRYPGADYVKVHFDRMLMLPGDYVTVADPTGKESYRYSGGDTGRWAMSVSGESAVVTVHSARPDLLGLTGATERLGVNVDKVARGFTPAERKQRADRQRNERAATGQPSQPGRTGREESVCGGNDSADAVCYRSSDPVAYARSKAVARLLINGTELCTAWRIGAGNRLLTNHHCFTTSDEAYNTEVWFDYQCAVCRGYETFQPTKVWGHQVLATDKTLDFTLFTVENFAAVQKFGYLELDPRRPRAGQEVYIPQHPGGDPTVIAMSSDEDRAGTCAVANPTYDGYGTGTDVSYYCDTEGGSSGSPVIARDSDKVVALHHFGGCPNSGVRVDLVYARIRSQL